MTAVLIVDPNKSRAGELTRWLRLGGFHADSVETHDSALRFLRSNQVGTLVVSEDLGFDVFPSLLRSIKGSRATTIVLGNTRSAKNTTAVLDLGADCYMPDPYSAREVLARIRSLSRLLAQPPHNIVIP